jgi:glycine/D-amino acid oxidase-like deaminating enzyme
MAAGETWRDETRKDYARRASEEGQGAVMKVIVIGAGIIGTALAYRLAQAGAAVTVVEADRVAGGTSRTSFAWFNSNNKNPKSYHDLNVAGMRAHKALKEEFGATPWLHEVGALEWIASDDKKAAQRANVERMKSWGYEIDFITRKELGDMEPDIDPAAVGDAQITFAPQEGWIDPVLFAQAMMSRALELGARLKSGAKVIEIVTRNGNAAGVRTDDGALHEADVVVNCAGRWADRVDREPAFQLPLAPTVGFMVFTPPVATSIGRPILSPTIDVRPDGAGRLTIRHDDVDKLVDMDDTPTATMPQSIALMRRAVEVMPSLKGVRPEAARVTARPIPRDGHSAVGRIPQLGNYYFVVTHSGVTLAAHYAQLAADEIVLGKRHPELDEYRPGRFFQ